MSDVLTVITPQAILSYPRLAEPQPAQNPGEKAKYSATFVFLPGADLEALKAAIRAAAEKKWPGKSDEMFRTGKLTYPIRSDIEGKGYPAGSSFISARNENQPGFVFLFPDPATGRPARVPDDKIAETFYPGAIVKAQVRAFAYDRQTKKGVSFGLHNIQKVAEGERLDGRDRAEDAFEVDLSAAPAELKDLL